MLELLKRALARIVSEPAVVLGVVIAAVTATTTQTWQGYAAAILTALLRFVVSPVPAIDKRSDT